MWAVKGIGRVSNHIYDGLLFLVALHGVESGGKDWLCVREDPGRYGDQRVSVLEYQKCLAANNRKFLKRMTCSLHLLLVASTAKNHLHHRTRVQNIPSLEQKIALLEIS